mgnify:FL=1
MNRQAHNLGEIDEAYLSEDEKFDLSLVEGNSSSTTLSLR